MDGAAGFEPAEQKTLLYDGAKPVALPLGDAPI